MAPNNNETLQAMESMLRENNELARQSRRITQIGSIAIVAIILICGLFLYNRYADFDVPDLQARLAASAPVVLRPELNNLSRDMMQVLYPQLIQAVMKRTATEMPEIRRGLEKQMVILIDELKESFIKQLEDETTLVVRESIQSGVTDFELTPEQRRIVDEFVAESVEYILVNAHPAFQDYSRQAVAQLDTIYATFHQLENTSLGKETWPADADEATVGLLKSMLKLAIVKLDQEQVRKMLKTSLDAKLSLSQDS